MLYIWSYLQTLGASLRRRDEGATMVEYGMVVAAIAIVVVIGAIALGAATLGWFNDAADTVVP